jgi:hypothetical protein
MMRIGLIVSAAVLAAAVLPARADELRPPLEKQFFEYFAGQCESALETQAQSRGKKLDQGGLGDSIKKYCACTSQAVVSHLSAGEIIAFANNPESEPGASKMKPYFAQCQGK